MLVSSRQNRETHKNIHQHIDTLEDVLDRALENSGKKLQKRSQAALLTSTISPKKDLAVSQVSSTGQEIRELRSQLEKSILESSKL